MTIMKKKYFLISYSRKNRLMADKELNEVVKLIYSHASCLMPFELGW